MALVWIHIPLLPQAVNTLSTGFEGRSQLSSVYVASTSFPVMLYHVAYDIHKDTRIDGEHVILNGVSD